MIGAYFDRNVFSALSELEGGLTAADVEKLTRAVRSGAIVGSVNVRRLSDSRAQLADEVGENAAEKKECEHRVARERQPHDDQ